MTAAFTEISVPTSEEPASCLTCEHSLSLMMEATLLRDVGLSPNYSTRQ
jgi:hypothetical protein